MDQHWFQWGSRSSFLSQCETGSGSQGAKPMRIHTDPDPGHKKLTLYMKNILKLDNRFKKTYLPTYEGAKACFQGRKLGYSLILVKFPRSWIWIRIRIQNSQDNTDSCGSWFTTLLSGNGMPIKIGHAHLRSYEGKVIKGAAWGCGAKTNIATTLRPTKEVQYWCCVQYSPVNNVIKHTGLWIPVRMESIGPYSYELLESGSVLRFLMLKLHSNSEKNL